MICLIEPHPLYLPLLERRGRVGYIREASPLFDSPCGIYFLRGEGEDLEKGFRPFKLPLNKMASPLQATLEKRARRLKLLPALNSSGEGDIIGVFQLGTEGKSAGEASDLDAQG
jgi:hypothetical protein